MRFHQDGGCSAASRARILCPRAPEIHKRRRRRRYQHARFLSEQLPRLPHSSLFVHLCPTIRLFDSIFPTGRLVLVPASNVPSFGAVKCGLHPYYIHMTWVFFAGLARRRVISTKLLPDAFPSGYRNQAANERIRTVRRAGYCLFFAAGGQNLAAQCTSVVYSVLIKLFRCVI